MSEQRLVNYRVEPGGVAVLTLNNPPLNLNTLGTYRPTPQTVPHHRRGRSGESRRHKRCWERAFSAGSDITEFGKVLDDVVEKKSRRENAAFTALERLPQPVIAALNGVTLGGGAEIALACDLRIMEDDTRIGFPEVNLGVFSGSGGVFRLPRLVGPSNAYRLLYTAAAAAVIIAEVGLDMTRFPTPAHLSSWARFAPGVKESAGRKKGNGSTGHGDRYLMARVLGEAAVSAAKTNTFLGERYRRIARRRGKKKAIVAVGRSILVIIWHLLGDDTATFHDLGPGYYDSRINPEHKKRNHIRELEALGYKVTLQPAA